MLRKRSLFAVMLVMTVGLFVMHSLSWAQADVDVAPGVISLSNSYIKFTLGVSGQAKVDDKSYDVPARFGVISITGDPETDLDNQMSLLWFSSTPLENHWRLKIGESSVIVGTGGSWTKVPRVVTPTAGLKKGYVGPYIEGEWTTAAVAKVMEPVVFRIHASLVRDQVRLETTIINSNIRQQGVGVGMFTAPLVSETTTNGYPFLPGIGLIRTANTQQDFYGTLLRSTAIPSILEIFDSVEYPSVVTRYTLRGQDCSSPDFLAIGDWDDLQLSNVWLPDDFTPDADVAIDELTLMAVWKQKGLARSASRKIVTYYGIGAATASWTKQSGTTSVQDTAMLAVQGPKALKYDSASTSSSDLTPNPFKIKAYVYNLTSDSGAYDLKNVTALLELPSTGGLEFVSGNGKREIGTVRINSESAAAEWSVRATGERCGELEYTVTVRDTNLKWSQVVKRKIMVPATKETLIRPGYQLISVPFAFNDTAITHAVKYTGHFYATWFDPTIGAAGAGEYVAVTKAEPCRGFWIKDFQLLTGVKPMTVAADARIVGEVSGTQADAVSIKLKPYPAKPGRLPQPGWNMIGNPFVYPVYLGQLLVQRDGKTVSFDEAVKANWITRIAYWYNPDKPGYEYLQTNDSLLMPWKGYWFRVSVPVTLTFRPAIFPGASVTTLPGGY